LAQGRLRNWIVVDDDHLIAHPGPLAQRENLRDLPASKAGNQCGDGPELPARARTRGHKQAPTESAGNRSGTIRFDTIPFALVLPGLYINLTKFQHPGSR
jgi:hypothetical protein